MMPSIWGLLSGEEWEPLCLGELRRGLNGHERVSKGIGSDDNHLKVEMLKVENEDKREGPLDFTSVKLVPDQCTLVDEPGAYGHSNVDDLTKGNQNGHKLAPCSLPLPQFEVVKKEREFYMDKAATEMELPKMILCYKEGSYHIIKDICIDEGLHSFDTVLVHNAVKDEKVYTESKFDTDNFTNKCISDGLKSSSLNGHPISDVNNEATEHASLRSVLEGGEDISHTSGEIVSNESQEKIFDEIRFPPQGSDRCQSQEKSIVIHNEKATQCSLACLLEEDRGNTDTTEGIVDASEAKEQLPVQELSRGHCHANLSSCESTVDQPQLVNSDIDQPKSIDSDSGLSQSDQVDSHQLNSVSGDHPGLTSICESTAQTFSVRNSSNRDQVDEGALEVANSTTSGMSSEEFKEEDKAKDLPGTGDSGGNIIAFDIDSEPQAIMPKRDSREMSEIQQSALATNSGMLDDTSTDGQTASSRNSVSHGHADANFLGPASLSGRIAYSGQVPYSGSISLRSDSSTTSTRSFAFPILQSEWNTSPVRMAKADQRHFRRHRGWRSGLLCCRF